MNTKQKQSEYIPYPLRYKEEETNYKQLLITTIVFGGSYFLFLGIIGLKLGWSL